MKASKYISDWIDKKYGGAKDLDGWTPEDVAQFAEDFAAQKETEETRQVLLNAVEIERRKQIFEVLNNAYDLVVEYSESQKMNRDDFKRNFSGIADDFKMAKLRYDVAKEDLKPK